MHGYHDNHNTGTPHQKGKDGLHSVLFNPNICVFYHIPFSLSKYYERFAVRTCCDCGCWPCRRCRCCRCCCCCWRSTYLSNPPEYCCWPSSVFQELSGRWTGKHVTADLLVFVTNFPGRRPVIAPSCGILSASFQPSTVVALRDLKETWDFPHDRLVVVTT